MWRRTTALDKGTCREVYRAALDYEALLDCLVEIARCQFRLEVERLLPTTTSFILLAFAFQSVAEIQ